MSWQPPPQPLQIAFDDEEAGGTASWYEHVPVGSPLPEYNDWVWGPDRAQEDGGPRLPRTTRYLVVRRGWSFVQPLSVNGQSGKWDPLVRIHVRRDETTSDRVDTVNEP